MSKTLCLCLAILCGCSSSTSKPTVKTVTNLDEVQGLWVVVEATDPNGNGFEADNIEMKMEGNTATSLENPLRLEFNADNSYWKIFAKVDGAEKQVGEVIIELTTEANPAQMIWLDRNNDKQVTLFQRKP